MKHDILDSLSKREQINAQQLVNNSCSDVWDLSVKFIQQPALFNHVPERVGCIINKYDFTDELKWDEASCCIYVKIKDEYKKQYKIQLLKVKRFTKKISNFFLLKRISNFYMIIEVYLGKYSENSECKMVYRDYITSNNTINVKTLVDFIYELPILLR